MLLAIRNSDFERTQMELAKIIALIADMQGMTVEKAYTLGTDCAINGADTINSHFSIFSKPEFTRAWEEGKTEHEGVK